MRRGEGRAAGAVSLGLSLSLAVLLLVMALDAGADRLAVAPAPTASAPPAKAVPEVDLAAVVLPPPPVAVSAAAVEVAKPPPAPPRAALPPPAPASAPPPRFEPPPPPARQPPAKNTVAPPAAAAPVAITLDSIREGRALLRLLEQGHGPDIEIAWPAAAADRSELYRLFSQCFGMRTVVISAAGTVYDIGGGRTAVGFIDGDRYSGFARRPAGDLSAEEQQRIDAIRRRYDVRSGQVLRLFPRSVDAILLGALHRIAGDGFERGVRIRARYQTGAAGILIADIRVAERRASEQIMLPFAAQQRCRADKIG